MKTKEIAKELIKFSGYLKNRVVHCDIKYTNPEKSECYKKRRLFLGGLRYRWTDDEIYQALSEHGRVRAAYCIKEKNGKSKGYGFVDFFCEEDAEIFLDIGRINYGDYHIDVKPYNKNFTPKRSLEVSNYEDDNRQNEPDLDFTKISLRKSELANVLFFYDDKEEDSVENEMLNSRRKENLEKIGKDMKSENLFIVIKGSRTIDQILEQGRIIREFNQRKKFNYKLNSSSSSLSLNSNNNRSIVSVDNSRRYIDYRTTRGRGGSFIGGSVILPSLSNYSNYGVIGPRRIITQPYGVGVIAGSRRLSPSGFYGVRPMTMFQKRF